MGLDIGTDSVGWAVTNKKYEVLKFHSKGMWGVRKYDSANTAAGRRKFRSNRRRNDRVKQRIKLLQELFAEEISKVDPSFFIRLKESKYYLEDKNKAVRQPYSLFADENFTDKQFYKQYPTIYHLRKTLIESKKKYDIRFYYLAIHNIIKNRGHFLFEGMKLSEVKDFQYVYNNWKKLMEDIYDIQISCDSITELARVIKDTSIGFKDKKNKFKNLFHDNSKMFKAVYIALAGGKFALSDLYDDENLIEIDENKISFSDHKYEERFEILQNVLLDRIQLLEYLKAIYDWGILARVLGDEKYLSYAKTKVYDKHKNDLFLLRKILKKYYQKSVYDEVLKDVSKKIRNYCSYIGYTRINGQKIQAVKKVGQEEFCKYLENKLKLKELSNTDSDLQYIIKEITARTFLPKQVSKINGIIPYQVHQMELNAILDNMELYYPFLKEKDENDKTVREKIERIFDFKIPYYVGPLNDMHANKEDWTKGNCWIVKKSPGKVLPWNFDQMVDVDATAERFIRRMTNKCTYLVGEDVLPKDSLLYSEFMVLNEINKLKINGQGISVELKQKIFNDVFKNKCIKGKITRKKLIDYLIIENVIGKNDTLSGIDKEIKSNFKSYQEMKDILGDKVNQQREMVEDIIQSSVIFGGDKKLLEKRLYSNYVEKNMLSEAELKSILKKRYSGWGRLSRVFLEEIKSVNEETGEETNIINALRNTNQNLMELLSRGWGFTEKIEKENKLEMGEASSIDDIVNKLQVSAPVKRSIWQTLRIVQEVRKITNKDPEKIFIEMAREKRKKKRTTSRKDMLIGLYKKCKDEERDWYDEISKIEEGKFSSNKLFLYYTQMGRCMYSGEPITLDSLYNSNIYDKDHIFPQSKTKDDSLDNIVLVKRTINSNKSDQYPIDIEIRKKQHNFWKMLKEKKLISDEKYNRLTRNTPLTNEELSDFINRQIVETRQSTKAVASILSMILPNSKIVYVKAKAVSDFRHDYGIPKVRELNDLHHAKDAYLNIVVGNVYNTKFTNNPMVFLKDKDNKYNLNRMYDFDVVRNNNVAWIKGRNGTIKTVRKYMNKNNIQVTKYAAPVKGGLFDQLLLRKGKGQVPIKESDKRLSIEKYGGYNKATGSYFMLVDSDGKKGRKRTLEFVPLYMAKRLEESLNAKLNYCKNIGLKNPIIIKECIKMNSLLIIDGFPMYISGRTNDYIIMKGAVQLILNTEEELYLKKIIKCNDKIQEAKKKTGKKDEKNDEKNKDEKNDEKDDTSYKIRESDNISCEMNIKVYSSLINKIKYGIYSKAPGFPKKILFSSIDTFTNLKLEEQIYVILELLKLYQGRNMKADLRLINGKKGSGSKQISKNISKYDSVILRNQSVTGLFSNDIDLLKI